VTTGAKLVLALLVICLLSGAATGAQIYYRLAYVWAFLLIATWTWSKLAIRGVRLTRQPRANRAQMGQVFETRYTLDNPGRLPRLWLVVRDESPLPGSQGSRLFPMIEGKRGRTYLARTRLLRRGVFPLGPTVLESGDPFGLFPVSRVYPAEESILVYPMLADVRQFPSPAGIMPGGEALRRRTLQLTPNAAGVREYAHGDPLNRIHWPSTARRDRLISKEFELDPQAEVWIFLDASHTGQASIPYELKIEEGEEFWRRDYVFALPPSTEEYAISATASIGRYFLRMGRSVGFASEGQTLSILPPERGGRQLGKLLEALALLRAEGNLSLRGLIEVQAQHLSRGSTVVIVTHSVEEDVALAVDFLVRRGQRPVVALIDASSFNGPTGTDQLAEMLRFLRVPVRIIRRGDEIGAALSASS
jgi:uncharacterized protein (DUF58 family)